MLKINKITLMIIFLGFVAKSSYATEFNLDVMDVADKKGLDISQFSEPGYVMPGRYELSIYKNAERLGNPQNITVYDIKSDNSFLKYCVPANTLDLLGLKKDVLKQVTYNHDNQCLDLSQIPGTKVIVDLSTFSLRMTIPQSYLAYSDPSWVPPALWDDGVNAAFADYTVSVSASRQQNSDTQTYVSASGTTGVNVGAIRVRADYSGQYQRSSRSGRKNSTNSIEFDRVYGFMSLKESAAMLTVGESSLNSNLFDGWTYTGASLESDESMLPPKLSGYAPEIIGTAKTNATVTVRLEDRVILETTVPPGPFRIDTLDSGIRGVLQVTIREDNGEERHFSLNTASLPYLSRPGRLVYKIAAGRTRYSNHKLTGAIVVNGEFSYGVSNAWSLYGGTQLSSKYQALAVGVGRDLLDFGTVSFDINQSVANLNGRSITGRSYRVNYTKTFEDVRASINFAGYRFADRHYRTLSQFINEDRLNSPSQAQKATYQLYLNKYFDNFNMSLNYQYTTYWRGRSETQYGLYTSTNINVPWLSSRVAYVSLSANRSLRDNGRRDDTLYLSLSIPLFEKSSLTFSQNYSYDRINNNYSSQASYSTYDDNSNYSLMAGYNSGTSMDDQSSFSGYYSHDFSQASISANFNYVPGSYRSIGASIRSGITATAYGVAMNRGFSGETRLMVATPGSSGVPLNNGNIKTNMFGVAIVPNMNDYRKSTVFVNTSLLPDDLEALQPSTEATLTKGAVGYREIEVLKGTKIYAIITQADGQPAPFGSSIRNLKNRELGIVGDDGVTWIVGVSAKEILSLYQGNKKQCELHLPDTLSTTDMLLLPCVEVASK